MKASRYLQHIDTLLFAIAAMVAVWLFTKYNGIGVSPDSVMYTSTARNIHNSGRFYTFTGRPIVDFPIFYPTFLAICYWLSGKDPIIAGAAIDMLLFAGVTFMAGWITQRFAPGKWLYKWVILAAIILNPAFLQVYSYLWSETLFIFQAMVFILAFGQYLKQRNTQWLIIAALVAAIGCITRYAAVTLIGAGGLILLLEPGVKFKDKWKPILTFGLIAISLLVANLVRNHLVTGQLTGPREASITGFNQNMALFGTVVTKWAGIELSNSTTAIVIAWLLTMVLVIGIAYHFFVRRLHHYLITALTFGLVYGLFIVLSSTFSRYEQINDRLLAPIYIPLLWGLTCWVVIWVPQKKVYFKYGVYPLGLLLAITIGIKLYKIDYQRYDDQFDYGNPGYTDDTWKESALVDWLRKHPQFFSTTTPIYSDAYDAVYFFSGQTGTKLVPHQYFKKDVERFYNQPHYYLIWFNDLYDKELIPLQDIRQRHQLKKIQEFEDGGVYEYSR
ncbi:hypothetical protein MUY27_09065 [Mucilaginibacter sp. RS28]|uniref:Dolichyl-phosphate-mannose-protein mannosyltransferase n=1 Tax=Mucilaginibacter straminoryzae TaxID=2932774 RepID=A0A9X1X2L2_9SPHI|nr:hypothetical protein [Mucilaginibacter straminoryzae]MCJ8209858.1 hypothetical protein [Mucilaginibacter straminoryzae]